MTLVEKFTAKYGINPIKLVEDANLEFFGTIKTLGLKRLLEDYIEKKGLKIELTDEFFVELVECFAEAGEKFPESQKAPEIVGATFEIPNQKVGIPKSKGTLENFKDIVGDDGLRPVLMGVYVSEDGFLVGTDAHKLVKLRSNEFSEEKGKIIDLSKYIKSKGKIIDFIDGKYPNYEAVIPKDNLEEKALSTYAFYNLAKSAQEVKRLTSNPIFNINLKLKTTDDKLEVYGFSYIIMLEALTFAMANGWDFFTLEYSTPSRAVVFNFGDGNIALLMPNITRDNEPRGAKAMTTEEIEENYRLGISKQKASKPKATQPARTNAPISSEPFKKFEGDLSDTTYVHRSQIDSIKLVSGEVLGKNDVIDGFYRVNKKMAHGGYMEKGGKLSNVQLELLNNLSQPNWYMLTNRGSYVVQQGKPRQGGETLGVNAKVGESLVKNGYVTKLGSIGSYSDLTIVYKISQKGKDSISKKMAHGGGVEEGYSLYKNIEFTLDEKDSYFKDSIGGYYIDLRNITYVGNNKYRALAVSYSIEFEGLKGQKLYDAIYNSLDEDFSRNDDIDASLVDIKILPDSQKMAHGGSMYANGGSISRYLVSEDELEVLQESGVSIKKMDEILMNKFPDSFGFALYPVKEGSPVNYRNLIPDTDNYKGIENETLKLTFNKYHGMSFRAFQGGENTYFYFILDGNDGNGYIGSFGFKDQGDVPKEYVTSFIALLTKLYGFPFKVSHEVYANGGSMYASGGKVDPIDMAEVESSAIFYTEKGKWSPEPTIEKFENQIKEYQEMKRALDNKEIRPSQVIGTGIKPQYVRPLAYRWIEERTLIAKRAIEILKERMGGGKSSSHEVGDTVTFNSVMGGTKTGTIISKIGDEGFRIATSDGFATIKKSAIV